MKKAIVVIIVLMMTLSFAACGNSAEPTGNKAEQVPEANESIPNSQQKAAEYTLKNEVIVDNDICSFTITEVREDSIWGIEVKTLCENKTEDKNLMFSVQNTAINGYLIDSIGVVEVTPGKKANCEITFAEDDLEKEIIATIDQLEFELVVYDNDDWMADHYVEETYTVFPTGKQASDITIPQRPTGKNEAVVVDTSDSTFILLDTYEDSIWGYTLQCYIENKSDKTLMFSWNDVSVNGFMIDPFFGTEITPGNRKLTTVSFSDDSLEENGIDSVEEIEYRLTIYDSDDWLAEKLTDDVFTYRPE